MRKALLTGALLAGVLFAGSAGVATADPVHAHAAPAPSPAEQLASKHGGSPLPPGSPGDENGNGILDSSEVPDNPDRLSCQAPLPSQVPPGSPGDENGNGQLDSSETPDNPDQPA